MLPNYSNYIKFHHKLIFKPITLASVILSLCFINNYNDLTFSEFFIGIYSIFFVVLFSAIKNDKAYWVYCVFSEKFNLDKVNEDIEEYKKIYSNKYLINIIKICIFFSSILILCFFSYVTLYLSSNDFTFAIFIMDFFIIPFLTWYCMRIVNYYYFYKAIVFLNEYSDHKIHYENFNSSNMIIKEILLSIVVNFPIVYPISRKSAFLLDNSCVDIHFIIALIILLYSVLGVMLFLSRGRKINYFMESILLHKINSNIEKVKVRSLYIKIVILIIVVPLFSVLVCIVFYAFNVKGGFFLIYIICLLPILCFYYLERMRLLYNDVILAFDMVLRLNALKIISKQ